MAINKSNTPVWMKTVLIILAAVFALGFVSVAANPFTLFAPKQGTGAGGNDAVSVANQKFGPRANALTSQLQSDPASYTVLVGLGNTYYDWALEIQKASKTSTATLGVDQPLWIAAKDAYSRAARFDSSQAPVMIDYSITQFYSGETSVAIETAARVTKATPGFPPAWFNLGIYYTALGDKPKAISSFERYVKLDPQGKKGDVNYAKQQLKQLKSGAKTP